MTFSIRLAPGGRAFTVAPGESILAAALRQGLRLAYSCGEGSCGSCKARILKGRVDYGDYQEQALGARERAQGWALLCQARPLEDLVIEARQVLGKIRRLPCRVVGMERVTADVMILHLKPPQGQALEFRAGQHVDVLLKDGRRRSFSLATPPEAGGPLELHVRHVPGGRFTGHVFAGMAVRELLRIEGPFGAFFLREDSDRPIILVAGGTGLAPVKSIIEHAAAAGIRRPMHLFWGVRARRDLYLQDLIRSWTGRAAFRYTPVLSAPRADDRWEGPSGWVHQAVLAEYPDLSEFEAYVSGPPPMVEAVRRSFPGRGLAEDRLYDDSFVYARD